MKTLQRLELLFAALSLLAAAIFLISTLLKLKGTEYLGFYEGVPVGSIVLFIICSIIALCSYLHVRRGSNIAGVAVICLGGLFFLFEAYVLFVTLIIGALINLFLIPIFLMTVFNGLIAGLALAVTVLKLFKGAQDVA